MKLNFIKYHGNLIGGIIFALLLLVVFQIYNVHVTKTLAGFDSAGQQSNTIVDAVNLDLYKMIQDRLKTKKESASGTLSSQNPFKAVTP